MKLLLLLLMLTTYANHSASPLAHGASGRILVALADPLCLPAAGGLGLCQSARQRIAALLAGNTEPLALATGSHDAGIEGCIGWHTFRCAYATLLKANGEDAETAQE
jgi:hypothetical protein